MSAESICERRGCDKEPTTRIVNESPILHEDPYHFDVCDEHAKIAAREFRETGTNVLASKPVPEAGT